jgi:polyferredoxin
MTISIRSFYRGPWRYLSLLFIFAIAAGGWFYPPAGLAVPLLIVTALVTNLFSRRYFCSSLCPNGRALSVSLTRFSRRATLPGVLRSVQARRALCGFMLFCVVNLLARSGGAPGQIARVFWFIYLISIGVSTVMGLFFKPRSWCAVCPVGTLQDTLSAGRRA